MVDAVGSFNTAANARSADNPFIGFDVLEARTNAATPPVAGRLAQARGPATRAPLTAAQVTTLAERAAQKYWSLYQSKVPEAFTGDSGVSRTTPTLRFARNTAEFEQMSIKATGHPPGRGAEAFVDPKNPKFVYVNTPLLAEMTAVHGAKYVDVVISHELIHVASSGMLQRMETDLKSNLPSSATARKDLNRGFYIEGENGANGSLFNVYMLLAEFPADYFAAKLTGIPADSEYGGHVKIGRELIKRVGEPTLRKALFANDPAAYQKVLEGARQLSEENKRKNDAQ